jgi:hypothetical protein
MGISMTTANRQTTANLPPLAALPPTANRLYMIGGGVAVILAVVVMITATP